jgi:peptidoglycan/LPS O-acetylase OafA/YrhL
LSPLRGPRSGRFDAVGLAGIALLLLPVPLPRWCESCAFLAGCPLLFLGAFRGRTLNALFTNPWIVTVGGMCYSIYLLHYAVIFVAVKTVGTRLAFNGPAGVNLLIQLAVCIPPLAAASTVYFALIERPCMRRDWPKRAWTVLTGRASAAR